MQAQLLDDTALVLRAQRGDRAAFADLYDRYFEVVYDFLVRTHLSAEDAADSTQEAFIKAMSAIGTLTEPERFRSWMFTIARNVAVSRLRSAKSALSLDLPSDDDMATPLATLLPDTDVASQPETTAMRNSAAEAVWSVAAGLDRRQYMVLDLSVRQGLEPDELADAMGVTRNNAYVMVNRTKKAFSEAATDYVDFTAGRRDCPKLQSALESAGQSAFSPDARRVIDRHVRDCQRCGERRKRLPVPLALFGGFALAAPPDGLKDRIRGSLNVSPLASATGSSRGSRLRRGSRTMAILAGAGLVLLIGAAGTTAGLWDADSAGGDGASQAAIAESAGTPSATSTSPGFATRPPATSETGRATSSATPVGADATATASTPRPSSSPTTPPTAGPSTPTVAGDALTPNPEPSAIPLPDDGVAPRESTTPTMTQVPTPTRTLIPVTPTTQPTSLPTATRTPTPVPPTPTPFPPTATPTIVPPTPTQVPQQQPTLYVDKVVACWLKGNAGLRVEVGISGQANDAPYGYVVVGGVSYDLSFSGNAGQAVAPGLKKGDYSLYVVAKAGNRSADRTTSSGSADC